MMARSTVRPSDRFDVFQRDRFTCRYCGKTPGETELQIDHILPIASGGSNSVLNLITSCRLCNAGKGSKEAQHVPIPLHVIEHQNAVAEREGLCFKALNEFYKNECKALKAVQKLMCFALMYTESDVRQCDVVRVRLLIDEFDAKTVCGWLQSFASKDIHYTAMMPYIYGCAKNVRKERGLCQPST